MIDLLIWTFGGLAVLATLHAIRTASIGYCADSLFEFDHQDDDFVPELASEKSR